jgi:Uma2 family endonuclease/transcriptional regulator with XRE-family HTH domain
MTNPYPYNEMNPPGANVRFFREARGWTQQQLCARTKMPNGKPLSGPGLSRIESNESFTRASLDAIATVLERPLIDLLTPLHLLETPRQREMNSGISACDIDVLPEAGDDEELRAMIAGISADNLMTKKGMEVIEKFQTCLERWGKAHPNGKKSLVLEAMAKLPDVDSGQSSSKQAALENTMTVAQYLEMERSSLVKHEYENGGVYAMTGTTDVHNYIMTNCMMILRNHFRGSGCRVFAADVKLRLEANAFYYPDVMVSCEKAGNCYYREQPVLVIEILSEHTVSRDRGEKWRHYQTLESLREYVLVSQECMDVRVFRRDEAGTWQQNIYTDGAVIPLMSVELEIPIERIYDEVWD